MTLDEKNRYLRGLSETDFLTLGSQSVVYVREVEYQGNRHFAVHSADGKPLTVGNDRDVLLNAIDQNELAEVTLH